GTAALPIGAVSQSAGTSLNVATLTVDSTGAVTLSAPANQLGTLGAVIRGGALTVNDSTGGLVVTGPITGGATANPVSLATAGGPLAVNSSITASQVSLAGVGITQAATSSVDAGAGTISLDGGGNAITLAGTLTTTSAGAAAVQIVDGGATTLGN